MTAGLCAVCIMEKKFTFEELYGIIGILRGENGCPWDKEQTHNSIKDNTTEEAQEVNEAVDVLTKTGDPEDLVEELGDLLLHVLFHCQIAEDRAEFTLEDVIDAEARKMIRRHPHVFGGKTYESKEEQWADWEAIKAAEREEKAARKNKSQS